MTHNKLSSPHSSAVHLATGKTSDHAAGKRNASRMTAKIDNDMLGSQDDRTKTRLSPEDELWLRNALQARLPIF